MAIFNYWCLMIYVCVSTDCTMLLFFRMLAHKKNKSTNSSCRVSSSFQSSLSSHILSIMQRCILSPNTISIWFFCLHRFVLRCNIESQLAKIIQQQTECVLHVKIWLLAHCKKKKYKNSFCNRKYWVFALFLSLCADRKTWKIFIVWSTHAFIYYSYSAASFWNGFWATPTNDDWEKQSNGRNVFEQHSDKCFLFCFFYLSVNVARELVAFHCFQTQTWIEYLIFDLFDKMHQA